MAVAGRPATLERPTAPDQPPLETQSPHVAFAQRAHAAVVFLFFRQEAKMTEVVISRKSMFTGLLLLILLAAAGISFPFLRRFLPGWGGCEATGCCAAGYAHDPLHTRRGSARPAGRHCRRTGFLHRGLPGSAGLAGYTCARSAPRSAAPLTRTPWRPACGRVSRNTRR